jgi:hypothetical protein
MKDTTACPKDETLMDFLAHRLAGKARDQVEHHLAGCADCLEQVAVCADLLDTGLAEESLPVPQTVTQKAVDAVLGLAGETWLHKLTSGTRHSMAKGRAALERLSWRPGPNAVVVRGDADTRLAEVIQREKQFEDLRVTIDIEKSGADQAMIRVADRSSQPDAAPVRVTLIRQNREVASTILGNAPIVFEEIPMGTYTLVFVRHNYLLGQYAFEMTDNP